MNIMSHGRVMHILDILQYTQDADEEEFERVLDKIEEVMKAG